MGGRSCAALFPWLCCKCQLGALSCFIYICFSVCILLALLPSLSLLSLFLNPPQRHLPFWCQIVKPSHGLLTSKLLENGHFLHSCRSLSLCPLSLARPTSLFRSPSRSPSLSIVIAGGRHHKHLNLWSPAVGKMLFISPSIELDGQEIINR